jgi:hypothetical protein
MFKGGILALLTCISLSAPAQSAARLLELTGKKMLESESFEQRKDASNRLEFLIDSLNESGVLLTIPFDSVKTLAVQKPDDDRFILITWNIPLMSDKFEIKGKLVERKGKITSLTDVKSMLRKPEQEKLVNGQWYGALYYDIEIVRYKKSTYYILLGYDAADAFTTGKIIEVLSFGSRGEVVFGAPLFTGKRVQKRVLFYYKEGAAFSLRFEKSSNRILFDHLSPVELSKGNDPAFLVPDFTVDAFKFKKGKYHYTANIDARNDQKNEGNRKKTPEKGLLPSR